MPTPRRDSKFMEALHEEEDETSTCPSIDLSVASTPSSPATSVTPLLSHKNSASILPASKSLSRLRSITARPSTSSSSPSQPKRTKTTSRLKRKIRDIVFGRPPPLNSEGWVLRPDLLFEMQKAKGKSGEDVRRDLERELERADAAKTAGKSRGGKEGKQGKKPISAAEVEALMLRYIVEG